jgi:hypothetical protein
LAPGKGHLVEPGGYLLAEVVHALLKLSPRRPAATLQRSCPFQFRDPLVEGPLSGFEVGKVDRACLVGVEEPTVLSPQLGELPGRARTGTGLVRGGADAGLQHELRSSQVVQHLRPDQLVELVCPGRWL